MLYQLFGLFPKLLKIVRYPHKFLYQGRFISSLQVKAVVNRKGNVRHSLHFARTKNFSKLIFKGSENDSNAK